MFLFTSHFPWWFGLYKKPKMIDLQMYLEAWLQEASLFRNGPVDYTQNFDLLSNEKANLEESSAAQVLPDLGWLDENIDLTVLDNPNSLPNHPNETETLMEDDAAFLLGFLDCGFDPSCLPSDAFKDQEIEFVKCLESENFTSESTSFETLDFSLESPQISTLQVNSPMCPQSQSPQSPFSDISDAPEIPSSTLAVTKSEASNSSGIQGSSSDSPTVYVAVYDSISSPVSSVASEEVLSIEEVSSSMRKRKFVNDGKDIPKVKVILKECPRAKSSRPKDRRERKKAQNKEAAARYRVKKRVEEQELSDEVEKLESHQKDLKEKHDELKSEIKYLKSLMCEILQKRGIMQ